MFTVPIPVPAQEVRESSGSFEGSEEEFHDEDERDEPERPPRRRPMNSFMRRVMEAFSVRGDAKERVETNIALPILASTGVFFGLGALAAGWYLSNTNREVGILRRTGRPTTSSRLPQIKRFRRQVPGPIPEVDQATFFQSIIQQAIEKQQTQHEDTPGNSESQPQNYYMMPSGNRKPLNRNDQFHDQGSHGSGHHGHGRPGSGSHGTSPNSKVSRPQIMKKTSWLGSKQALNFAKVAIPALVMGGAVIAIGVLIFGWYITGSNREIAFLEPSAYSRTYSRRKRDLTTTALSEGWLQRVLTSIHGTGQKDDSFPFAPPTSKHSLDYHANLSDAVVAVSLAVLAFFSLMAILLAWLVSENEKSNLGLEGSYGFAGWPGSSPLPYGHLRRIRRDLMSNQLHSAPFLQNPNFVEKLLADLELRNRDLIRRLEGAGLSHDSARKMFCLVMATQSDETLRQFEKRLNILFSK